MHPQASALQADLLKDIKARMPNIPAGQLAVTYGILSDKLAANERARLTREIDKARTEREPHARKVGSAEFLERAPEKIIDSERLMPGEVVADLTGFLQALKKVGYRDGISPEVFGRGLKEMTPEAGARLGLETTLAVMKKAGVA